MIHIDKEKAFDFLLPNCFFQSMFASIVISMVLCPLVVHNEGLRIIMSGAINGVITLVLGINFLIIFLKSRNKKALIVAILPILFVCISYSYSFITYGINTNSIVSCLTAILFSFQFYFVAVYVLVKKKVEALINNFDVYNICVCMFSLLYIGRFLWGKSDNFSEFFGMSYMSIAYTCLISIIPFLFRIVLFKEYGKYKWRLIVAIILWVTIVYSGTRGPIICAFFFLLVFMLYSLYAKKKKEFLNVFLMSIMFMGILLFSVYIWSPAESGAAGRLQNFDYDREIYKENEEGVSVDIDLPNSEENDVLQKTNNYVLNIDGTYSIIDKIVFQDIYRTYILERNQKYEESVADLHNNLTDDGLKIFISDEENEEEFKNYNLYMGRNLLMDFALKEFNKSRLFGNGPMYYLNKYDRYSHNLFTDILCDFGITGIILFFVLVMGLFIINLKSIRNDRNTAMIAIFTVSMCASYMVSGNMYEGSFWVFLCSFAILNYLLEIEEKHEVKH